jgi:biotin transport system substrate-specific component
MSTFSLAAPARPRAVLADRLAGSATRDAALILAGAALTALCAQLTVHVPGSPVPVTAQTFAVVVVASVLGARRGVAALGLYVVLGLMLPVYADGASGWRVVWGASGGYLVGFELAAWVVGTLAEHGADRRPGVAALAFAGGQIVIFGIGVPWLKVAADLDWATAIHTGFTIFILGGVIKALAAAAVTTSAWRWQQRR